GLVARVAACSPRPRAAISDRRLAGMSEPTRPRGPRVFEPDDPSLLRAPEPAEEPALSAEDMPEVEAGVPALAPRTGIRWGAILGSASSGIAALAFCLSQPALAMATLARTAIARWLAVFSVDAAAISARASVPRATAGMTRLPRLGRVRRGPEDALDA